MEKKTLRICLVRHGETEENISRVLQGHMPGRLTENGRMQIISLRSQLDLNDFDVVLSSDLKRVKDTVELLLDGKQIKWLQWPMFREIDWGSLTGMKIAEVNLQQLPADVETKEMLYDRAGRVADKLRTEYAGQTVLLVSHGLFLRSLIAHLPSTGWEMGKRAGLRSDSSCSEEGKAVSGAQAGFCIRKE